MQPPQIVLFRVKAVNLLLLTFEDFISCIKFLLLVFEPVKFGFELVGLLLFYELHVSLVNLLDLCQTIVAQTISMETYLSQVHVLVQDFEQLSFNLLAEKVVVQADALDLLVQSQGINQVNQTEVIQPTRRQVKLGELGTTLPILTFYNLGKEL